MATQDSLNGSLQTRVSHFFDPSTFSYVVRVHGCQCAIIDSVLGFDLRSGVVSTAPLEEIARFVNARSLLVQWLLESHVHADHLSGAAWLRERVGGKTSISEKIINVQKIFMQALHLGDDFAADGSQFDHLFDVDEHFMICPLAAFAMSVPGHTPAEVAYCIGDNAMFVGNTLFMPNVGPHAAISLAATRTGVTNRSLGSWRLHQIQSCICVTTIRPRGAMPPVSRTSARNVKRISTCDWHRRSKFTAMRTARDANLSLPQLFFPSIQAHVRGGYRG